MPPTSQAENSLAGIVALITDADITDRDRVTAAVARTVDDLGQQ